MSPFTQPVSERLKILFTSTHQTPFIQEDLELLGRHFDLEYLQTSGIRGALKIPLRLTSADVTFTWFASTYSALVVAWGRLFGKRSIIVIGGVDASKDKEINYGVWLSPWKAVLVKWAMQHATKLLVVDPFFIGEVKRLAEYDGANVEYVPTGYDAATWFPSGAKEPRVLTVAACHDELRMRKKGLDILFAAARQLPGIPFAVIGLHPSLAASVRTQVSSNVEIIPYVEQKDLLTHYQRAHVYCQPSYTEGLPNSLCEAMLCECVPVGTNVGGIPTAVRDIGFLVPYGDVDALTDAIRRALAAPRSVGQQARSYIAETFTRTRREESLLQIIREVMT